MACADSVPGVSGGTIAFIMGFYDKFINSLDGLIYGKKEEKKSSLKKLLKRVSGWCKDIKTLSEEGLGVNRVFALRCN